jgi:hypothetical protein
MDEEIKDAATTLLMALANQAGEEFEDERMAVGLIAETIKEMIKESKG